MLKHKRHRGRGREEDLAKGAQRRLDDLNDLIQQVELARVQARTRALARARSRSPQPAQARERERDRERDARPTRAGHSYK